MLKVHCPKCRELIDVSPGAYPKSVLVKPCRCMITADRESTVVRWNAHLAYLRAIGIPIPPEADAKPPEPDPWM